MPVWILLQPRDYINSLQLISSLALVVIGLGVAATIGSGGQPLEFVAPAMRLEIPNDTRPIIPLMFVTIACGAISGFHCLVSSGTSSKQLKSETDAQFVGYGSMLMEAFLATLVIIAVGAGIGFGWATQFPGLTGTALWNEMYATWGGASTNAIGAFVVGSANLLEAMGIDKTMAKAIMGVLVASFAGTTLDTATRLQRYVVQELAGNLLPKSAPANTLTANPMSWLANKHGATLFAVTSAFILAILPGPGREWSWANLGTGGLLLWPLFGATNQLLAGFAFLVITFWLWRRNKPVWFILLPTVFMLIMPAWAMMFEIQTWWAKGSYMLIGIAVVTLLLEAWMIVEAVLMWPKARGVLEESLPPLPKAAPALDGSSA
jgi:carbon starvation protein